MTGQQIKQFVQWKHSKRLKLASCDCGMFDGEHDVDCSLVLSEEKLYEQWQAEMSQKEEKEV
jgi:hypothetical protein